MKEQGKVKDYDGYYGKIVNEKGNEFLLLKEEVEDGQTVTNDDLVSFVPEEYVDPEFTELVARFVKKLEKKPNNGH